MTTEELTTEVQKALEEIRPFLNSDGGDITLVSIEDGKHVKVRLEGACTSCSERIYVFCSKSSLLIFKNGLIIKRYRQEKNGVVPLLIIVTRWY
jgi:hypothetical protein